MYVYVYCMITIGRNYLYCTLQVLFYIFWIISKLYLGIFFNNNFLLKLKHNYLT